MTRFLFTLVIGIVVLLMGGTFILQGLGFMAGTAMSGQFIWAAVGLVLVAVGAFVVYKAMTTKVPAQSRKNR